MRYYDIRITKPSGELVRSASFARLGLTNTTFTSVINGRNLPGALAVEINVPAAHYHAFEGGSYVRIWGLSIRELSQSNDLSNCRIVVKAGMSRGLPLAKPQQSGIIAQGKIFQAFGNWVGTDQSLDLQMLPADTGTQAAPKNYSFVWQANTPLREAIETTLAAAMPGQRPTIAISDQLKMAAPQWGIFGMLQDFAKAISQLTTQSQFNGIRQLSGATYQGVKIIVKDNRVLVYDGTVDYSANTYVRPKAIAFEDMIGQPTWISPTEVNFKTVMRADVSVGDYVRLSPQLTPPYVLTSPGAAIPGAPSRNDLTFRGTFKVTRMQHFGHSRQPDAASWCTSFNAAFIQAPSSSSAGGTAP